MELRSFCVQPFDFHLHDLRIAFRERNARKLRISFCTF
jgi:hypothetical protein